jgi:predicted membrane protein
LIIIGLLFLLDNLNIAAFADFDDYIWPLLLIGGGLLLLFRAGRQRYGHHDDFFAGSRNVVIDNECNNRNVSMFFGELTVDLTESHLGPGTYRLTTSNLIGETTIIVPRDMAVKVTGSVTLGDLIIFDRKNDGFFVSADYISDNYETASTKLLIETSTIIGETRLLRSEKNN